MGDLNKNATIAYKDINQKSLLTNIVEEFKKETILQEHITFERQEIDWNTSEIKRTEIEFVTKDYTKLKQSIDDSYRQR